MKRTVALAASLLVLAGCGSSDSGSGSSATSSSSNCQTPPAELVKAILDGSKQGGAKLTQDGKAAAVQSKETGSWFVAIRFKHDTGTDAGVWQTKSLTAGQAAIGSVDSFAKTYTQWPDTGNAGADAEGAAKDCV